MITWGGVLLDALIFTEHQLSHSHLGHRTAALLSATLAGQFPKLKRVQLPLARATVGPEPTLDSTTATLILV